MEPFDSPVKFRDSFLKHKIPRIINLINCNANITDSLSSVHGELGDRWTQQMPLWCFTLKKKNNKKLTWVESKFLGLKTVWFHSIHPPSPHHCNVLLFRARSSVRTDQTRFLSHAFMNTWHYLSLLSADFSVFMDSVISPAQMCHTLSYTGHILCQAHFEKSYITFGLL